MAEQQITVGDTTLLLERMFFSIATQNPVEMEGTYPLPAAQLDRFFMKIYFGYVDEQTELNIYRNYLSIARNLTDCARTAAACSARSAGVSTAHRAGDSSRTRSS